MFVMSTVIITGSTTLRELDVSYNYIGDNGISEITKGLQSNNTLVQLNVAECDVTAEGSY